MNYKPNWYEIIYHTFRFTSLKFSKQELKLIQQEYQKDLLYHYASSENIKQDIKAGEPALNFDYIIENYVI